MTMATEDALTLALLALDACVRAEAADQVRARMRPRQASEAMYRLSEARRTLRRSHPPRCASCGDPLAIIHGPAYCADALEGSPSRAPEDQPTP